MEEQWGLETFETARAILGYLEEHQDAKDTLEGIAQWWLLKEGRERSLKEVESAVAVLLSRGLIIETRRGALPPFYGLNRDRLDQIAKLRDQGLT